MILLIVAIALAVFTLVPAGPASAVEATLTAPAATECPLVKGDNGDLFFPGSTGCVVSSGTVCTITGIDFGFFYGKDASLCPTAPYDIPKQPTAFFGLNCLGLQLGPQGGMTVKSFCHVVVPIGSVRF